jgi:hypothetical protein
VRYVSSVDTNIVEAQWVKTEVEMKDNHRVRMMRNAVG